MCNGQSIEMDLVKDLHYSDFGRGGDGIGGAHVLRQAHLGRIQTCAGTFPESSESQLCPNAYLHHYMTLT